MSSIQSFYIIHKEKFLKKQTKAIEEQERKGAIANQNKRLAALTNKDFHKDNYETIFEKLVKERFNKTKELNEK